MSANDYEAIGLALYRGHDDTANLLEQRGFRTAVVVDATAKVRTSTLESLIDHLFQAARTVSMMAGSARTNRTPVRKAMPMNAL